MKRYFILFLGVIGLVLLFVQFMINENKNITKIPSVSSSENASVSADQKTVARSDRKNILMAERVSLPLPGSTPVENVAHAIPLNEIRRGCGGQDCIPSVDTPEFVDVTKADKILPDDTVGIGLVYKGVERFYPFNMLVTREIVNDVVAGDPLLVTYCPLCGTGIVFDRTVDGVAYEFGVSGMLWQSNLLMYNRAQNLNDRNLWSQVLGEAVVGHKTGTKLDIVPSDIQKYTVWREVYPDGEVLNTGSVGDPYRGEYYRVAQNFAPDFDEKTSELPPTTYVYGIEIEGVFKAYPRNILPEGVSTDTIGEQLISITRAGDSVTITVEDGSVVSDVEGFWFSWKAAHPDTLLWNGS